MKYLHIKMSIEIEENATINAYLHTQMRVLHVQFKKITLIFSSKCEYYKFGPKIQCMF